MNSIRTPSPSPDLAKLPKVCAFAWDVSKDCVSLSAAAKQLLGVSGGDTFATDAFLDCIHPGDRLTLEAGIVHHLEQGGEFTCEFRFLRPDGATRHVMWHSAFTRSQDTEPARIDGIFIDVTQSRTPNHTTTPVRDHVLGSFELDLGNHDMRWSPELRSMFNRQMGVPITADTVRQSVHPDDRDRVMARIQSLKSTTGPYTIDFRVVLPDGRALRVRDIGVVHGPIDPASGHASRVTGQLIDMTPTDERERPGTLATDTFWRLVDTSPMGVYAVDADMKLARINASGLVAFTEIDDLIGRRLDEILHSHWPDEFASDAMARFQHTLETGERYDADPVIEYRADRKTLEAYDWSIERIIMDDGRPGVLCYFYDLTERVRNERALDEQRQLLDLAYKSANMGAWDVDLHSGDTTATQHLCALFGQPDFQGNFAELFNRAVHPDDLPAINAAFQGSIASGARFDQDFRIIVDGQIRYISSSGDVITDADGRPSRFIGINQDITDRKLAEMAVLESEERMRTVIDKTVALVGVLNPDGTLRDVNEPAVHFAGLPRSELLGKNFYETFWWTHDRAVSDRCKAAVMAGQQGQTERFDVVVRGEDDTLITIDFMLAPVFDDNGEIQMLVASGFDISEREAARAREKDLMGEINHRTKNVLTLVQSLARQTARSGGEDFLPRFEGRLNALAKAQDLLFESTVDKVDLHDLIGSQLSHFSDQSESRIIRRGPKVTLSHEAAQALGMALHELGTNAGKYGALSSDSGRVEVAWDISTDTGKFKIIWTERDGPPVTSPSSKGFGSMVIDQMTKSVLNADVALDYAPEGVTWTLTCASVDLSQPS